MTGESDAQLVGKSLQGNEKAFRHLVERHQPMVYAVVRGVLGDREDVDDVVQDVFIKIYRGMGSFRGDAQFSSWVYRIARNEAVNAARRGRASGVPVDEIEIAAPLAARPDVEYERRDQSAALERYLGQLDEEYRVVLELRYMGEKSYAEISELTDLPVGTVKSYIHRAKIELKRVMTKRTLDGERKDLTRP